MPHLPLKKDDIINNPPQPDDRWYYPYVRINGSAIDMEVSAEGRYKGFFASAEGGVSNHVFEFSATNPIITETDGDKHAYGRWVIATLSSSKASGNFGAAIANATISASGSISTNKFRAWTLGIENSKWDKLRKVPLAINGDTIDDLGEAMYETLAWCAFEAKTGKYSPLAVCQITDFDFDIASSIVFALNRIKRGDSFDDANAFLDDKLSRSQSRKNFLKIDTLTIAAVYHRLKLSMDDVPPTNDQTRLAADILKGSENFPTQNNNVQGYWYEIGPYRLEDGTVPSLKRLSDNAKRISVNSWPIDSTTLGPPRGEVGAFKLHFQTALQISSSSLLDLNTSNDVKINGYSFASSYVKNGLEGSIVLDEKYTIGFKVKTRTSDFDGDISVQSVAAKASLGISNVSYEIESIGINLGGLDAIPSFASAAIAKFDLNTLSALGALYSQASSILNDSNSRDFKPVLTAVKLNLGAPEVQSLIESGIGLISKLVAQIKASKGDAKKAIGLATDTSNALSLDLGS